MPIPTPTMPGAGFNELMYRGQAMAQLRILKQQMNLGGLKVGERTVNVGNGVVIYCRICFSVEEAFVRVPPSVEFVRIPGRFISTPRLLDVNDGYGFVNGVLTAQGGGSLAYPLEDASATSQVLDISASGVATTDRTVQLYGNVDWKGWGDATGRPPVLTWRGPPGRSVPIDYRVYVAGLSRSDISFDESDFWTVFGPEIYQGGVVAYTVPVTGDVAPKVLGCAYQRGTLVCIVNNHYSDRVGFFDEVWINKGDTALYDSVNHPNGWRKLHERNAGRPTQCWFFNASGTKATQGLNEYSINAATATVSVALGSPTFISVTYTKDSDTHEVAYSGETVLWSDYKGDVRVFAKIVASGGSKFASVTSETSSSAEVPVYFEGTKPATNFWVTGPGFAEVGTQYSLEGTWGVCGNGDIQWSFSGGSINSSGTITGVSACGPSGAMGTITAETSDGTATLDVRLAGGVWMLTGSAQLRCSSWVGPCDNYPCGDSNASGACKTMYMEKSAALPNYISVETVSGNTKCSGVWGCGYIADVTYTMVTTNGDGGCAPAAPGDGWHCTDGVTQPQLIQQASYEWVCP